MKIIDNVLRDFEFSELGVGATFKHQGNYYLRIEDLKSEWGVNYNAVELYTGKLCAFIEDAKVSPFNCELIVL
jgi:hypothetical protein